MMLEKSIFKCIAIQEDGKHLIFNGENDEEAKCAFGFIRRTESVSSYIYEDTIVTIVSLEHECVLCVCVMEHSFLRTFFVCV